MTLSTKTLYDEQVEHLSEAHFLILYWAAQSEGSGIRYNITNCFDDLKAHSITRTKQTAVASVEALASLRFIELREEGNRKNIYITTYGAKALETLVLARSYTPKPSSFLEGR